MYLTQLRDFPAHDARALINLALQEDAVDSDITSSGIYQSDESGRFLLHSRQTGVICGLPVISEIIDITGALFDVFVHKPEGSMIHPGDVVAQISGRIHDVLRLERTMLNFLTMMSGIATRTRRIADVLAPHNIRLLDTRKTIPGFRRLSKYAVACGGGWNHRMHLGDMGLIKDNHIAYCGGDPVQAIHRFRNRSKQAFQIELDDPDQLNVILSLTPDLLPLSVLLDNMTGEQLHSAARIRSEFRKQGLPGGQVLLEASGGFHEGNLDRALGTGIDAVSIGNLTAGFTPLDLGLDDT